MAILKKTIHFRAIFGSIGALLHVPAFMALFTCLIGFIFEEHYAYIPLLSTSLFSLIVGQILYRCCYQPRAIHLWDAMIIAAISWLVCPLIAAIPFYWICSLNGVVALHSVDVLRHPINAIFEAFSGFTSTGLTLVKNPENFPHVIQFWRSFTQWIGGIGLVVFILTLMGSKGGQFQLYYAEARSEKLGRSIKETTRIMLVIYLILTLFSIFLFFICRMPLWEAINHAMTGIATGGFTVTKDGFVGYNSAIQIAAIFIMILGAISFYVHYQVMRFGKVSIFWKSMQHRVLLFYLLIGCLLTIFLVLWLEGKWEFVDSCFQWVSSLATCGFNSAPVQLYPSMVKLLFIFGMIVGGTTGSTVGGLKIQRIINLASSIIYRLRSIMSERVEEEVHSAGTKYSSEEEVSGIAITSSEQTARRYSASILFMLWINTLILGWFFLLRWFPADRAFDVFFDCVSSMSNVGLSTGIVSPSVSIPAKCIFMALMWIGRLEIIPAMILVFSSFGFLTKNKGEKKKPKKAKKRSSKAS